MLFLNENPNFDVEIFYFRGSQKKNIFLLKFFYLKNNQLDIRMRILIKIFSLWWAKRTYFKSFQKFHSKNKNIKIVYLFDDSYFPMSNDIVFLKIYLEPAKIKRKRKNSENHSKLLSKKKKIESHWNFCLFFFSLIFLKQ